MQSKFFIGKLNVRIGEMDNKVAKLFVARSFAQADELLEQAAASYYGSGDEPREDEGYYANDGQVHVSAFSLQEIGLAAFLDLKSALPVDYEEGLQAQTTVDVLTEAGFKAFAGSVNRGLSRSNFEVGQARVLNILAASFGETNWHHLAGALKELRAAKAPAEAEQAPEGPFAEVLQHRISFSFQGEDAPAVLDEASVDHIEAQIRQGFNQGELNFYDQENDKDFRGWWSIVR